MNILIVNYQEFEHQFQTEQQSLRQELHLAPLALDPQRLSADLRHLRIGRNSHRVGAALGLIFLIISVVLALHYFHTPAISWPLFAAAFAMAYNYIAYPVQDLPVGSLDRYTTTELACRIRDWRAYALRRLWPDWMAVSVFLLALFNLLVFRWTGTIPLVDPLAVPAQWWYSIAGMMALGGFGGLLMTRISNASLLEVEEQLASYLADDYV